MWFTFSRYPPLNVKTMRSYILLYIHKKYIQSLVLIYQHFVNKIKTHESARTSNLYVSSTHYKWKRAKVLLSTEN